MTRNHFVTALVGLSVVAGAPVQAQAPPAGTIIVANMRDDSVWLLDAVTGERRASIATHIAPHEVAVSSDGRWAAVTNYGDQRGPGNLIQILDVAEARVEREITVSGHERLHGVAFLEGDSLLAVTSEQTGEVLVVSAADGAVRRSLSTGGQTPHMLSLGGEWIYAANVLDGTVARVDASGTAETVVWPAGDRTEGVAATPDGLEGWTGSMEGGEVVGLEGATGRVVARVAGIRVPYRLAVTADGSTVVVSDPPAGELVLIDRSSETVGGRVDFLDAARAAGFEGNPSPQGFVLTPDGAWAFVSLKAMNAVAAVELSTGRVHATFDVGEGPDGVGYSPARGRTSGTEELRK